ncbi:MAG: hypothetical protein ACI4V7_09330 [Succinivibrionaceae bacterium]
MVNIRGYGWLYFVFISFLASVLVTIPLYINLVKFKENDFLALTQQIPCVVMTSNNELMFLENYLNDNEVLANVTNQNEIEQCVLSSNVTYLEDSDHKKYVVIYNNSKRPLIVVNPNNADISAIHDVLSIKAKNSEIRASDAIPTFLFYKDKFEVRSINGSQQMPYSNMGTNKNILISNDYIYKKVSYFINVFGLVVIFISMIFAIIVRGISSLLLNIIITLIIQSLLKVKIPLVMNIRFNIFASTISLIIFVVSMYFYGSDTVFRILNNQMITFLPLIYIYLTLKDMRSIAIEYIYNKELKRRKLSDNIANNNQGLNTENSKDDEEGSFMV